MREHGTARYRYRGGHFLSALLPMDVSRDPQPTIQQFHVTMRALSLFLITD